MHQPNVCHILLTMEKACWLRIIVSICSIAAKVYVNGPQGIGQPYQYILYHNKRIGQHILFTMGEALAQCISYIAYS